ncbi:hypothetical protein ACFY2R_19295 [Micromonospora olivasterospora]|uniref:Uncharacterized protein n=1 Tax=Micromonospora olivasterospora TaxID=1880 RepID=A0A562IGD7_MICOL|nr:hypothetical protein [Micromonospora olivasterospora]TWH69664.1 hypothetical protein JD77_04674 [Micromonospora olivasterospora]
MADDAPVRVPRATTTIVGVPADPAPVEPPSSLDLWARGQELHRCFGDDDGEPHILRGLD